MLRTIAARSRLVLAPRLHTGVSAGPATRRLASQSKQDESPPEPSPSTSSSDPLNSPMSDPAPDTTSAEPLSPTEQLSQQLSAKEEELAALNDRVLRVLAEMENVRTIARRDVENARRYAIVPFANGLLSVADNLGLALKAVPEELLADPTHAQLKGLFFGVGATEQELLKVFAQHGITRFGEIGEKFDPNKYQAVFEAPSPDHEPGTVIDVAKLGYAIGERILRPAEVGVAKAP